MKEMLIIFGSAALCCVIQLAWFPEAGLFAPFCWVVGNFTTFAVIE